MRSCQAPFPGWPWIYPVICYTASPDSDEHSAGSWWHPYSLPKKREMERGMSATLQNFTHLRLLYLFEGLLGEEMMRSTYTKWNTTSLRSIKPVQQIVQMLTAPSSLIKLPLCNIDLLEMSILINLSFANFPERALLHLYPSNVTTSHTWLSSESKKWFNKEWKLGRRSPVRWPTEFAAHTTLVSSDCALWRIANLGTKIPSGELFHLSCFAFCHSSVPISTPLLACDLKTDCYRIENKLFYYWGICGACSLVWPSG